MMEERQTVLRGELALLLAVVINSFGVVLMLRSGSGIEGAISLDFRGKLPGRGAYLCPDSVCLARARKSKALERAFAQAIPPEVYERLEEQMKEVPGDAP